MEVQVLLTAPDGTMRYLFRFLFVFLPGVLDFIVVEMKPAGCLLPGCRQPSPRPVFGIKPGFPLRYHYDSGLTPNAENKDACFTVTSLYIGAFPG